MRASKNATRWWAIGAGLVALALLLAVGLVATGAFGNEESDLQSDNGVRLRGVAETRRLLADVPQDGTLLGRSDAPVTVHEFTDLKCPACGQRAVSSLEPLVKDLLRSGKANLRLHLVNVVDPVQDTDDGARALRAAVNFAATDRFWAFALMVFQNQGRETTEWATEMRLRDIAAAAPGVGQAALETGETSAGRRMQRSDQRRALDLRVQGVPSFFVQPRGATTYTEVGNAADDIPRAVATAALRARPVR